MFCERYHAVFTAGDKTTINLLLLGETGTGKSTWINGFANYVSFESLADAEEGGGEFPIRTTFLVIDPETYEDRVIATDKNVLPGDGAAGQSVTQESRLYSFTYDGSVTVNVIDTPGLFSTEDVLNDKHEKDKQHVENILHFIGRFDELHAICILLKPNQARITSGFAYCIREIFRHLHESATKNVIFVITNAKSTNFQPGNTLPTLRAFLTGNSLCSIKPGRNNVYCIENDTVQHIVEHINGLPHDDNARMIAEMSWEKSVETTTKILTYVQNLQPHKVAGTQCIYNTRRLIGILSKVLFDTVKCSMNNLEKLKAKKMKVMKRQLEIQTSPEQFVTEDIREIMYTEIQKIEIKELEHSNTVCKSPECSEVVGNERHFKQICCKNCKGFMTLWTCRAFGGISGAKCRECGCERAEHEWRATETWLEKEVLFDDSEAGIEMVLSRDDALSKLNAHCNQLEVCIGAIEREQKQMLETGAIMSLYLKQNALLSATASDNLGTCLRNEFAAFVCAYSKTQSELMRQLSEFAKTAHEVHRQKRVDDINKDINNFVDCKENLWKLIEEYDDYYKKAGETGKVYTTLEVCSMIDELYKLARDGETLKTAVLQVERCHRLAIQNDDSKISIVIRKISKVWQIFNTKKRALMSLLSAW